MKSTGNNTIKGEVRDTARIACNSQSSLFLCSLVPFLVLIMMFFPVIIAQIGKSEQPKGELIEGPGESEEEPAEGPGESVKVSVELAGPVKGPVKPVKVSVESVEPVKPVENKLVKREDRSIHNNVATIRDIIAAIKQNIEKTQSKLPEITYKRKVFSTIYKKILTHLEIKNCELLYDITRVSIRLKRMKVISKMYKEVNRLLTNLNSSEPELTKKLTDIKDEIKRESSFYNENGEIEYSIEDYIQNIYKVKDRLSEKDIPVLEKGRNKIEKYMKENNIEDKDQTADKFDHLIGEIKNKKEPELTDEEESEKTIKNKEKENKLTIKNRKIEKKISTIRQSIQRLVDEIRKE